MRARLLALTLLTAVSAVASAVVTTVLPATAEASLVRALSPPELAAGADAIVEGTVVGVTSSWNADQSGLETRVTVAVARTIAGTAPPLLTIVQPGGELDGNRHVIVGMPEYAVGEAARLYLRRLPTGEAEFRVYGWAQGRWPGRDVAGVTIYAPDSADHAARMGGFLYFTVNGMVWPPAKIPVPYLVNSTPSDDLGFADGLGAIQAAFATWQSIPCSTLSYTYAGETTLGVDVDGQNVLLWIESGWIYGAEAAGATSLWIPIVDERTADVAFNGEHFTWALGPSGALAAAGTLDVQGVLTHELGHFSGLGHTMSAVDTMYYSWRPWASQRSLSADDKRGLCSLYPQDANECATVADCPPGDTCEPYEHGTLCTTPAAAIGTFCNYDVVECEDFCLFTAGDLSTGYCSKFCATDDDCPLTHHCAPATAGSMPVEVCFDGAQPPRPDAGSGDVPDGGGPASCAAGCPVGQYCGANDVCTYDCLVTTDCGGAQTCTAEGRCQAADGSGGACGCRVAARRRGATRSLVLLVVVLAVALTARGGRRRRSR